MNWLPYIVHIPIIILFIYLLDRSFREHPLRYWFYPALLLKILAGLGLGWVFLVYYGNRASDTFVLFNESMKLLEGGFKSYLSALFFDETSYARPAPRVFFTAKIISPITFITFKNYWLTNVYFSFLSFAGFWYFSSVLLRKFHGIRWPVFFAFFIFPSVVFSTSGVQKETITLFCMVVIAALLIKDLLIEKRWNWASLIIGLVLAYVLGIIKYYYLGAFVPVLIAYTITVLLKRKQRLEPLPAIGVFLLIFCGLLCLATLTHPNLHFTHFMEALVQNHDTMFSRTESRSLIYYNNLQPTLGSFLHNLPEAIISGLYRPFVWEVYKPIQIITGVENFLILFFSLVSIYTFATNRFRSNLLVWAIIVYVLFLASLLALSSPNWGTLDRYKVGFKPFLLVLIFIPCRWVMSDIGEILGLNKYTKPE